MGDSAIAGGAQIDAHMGGDAAARALQSLQQAGQGDVERLRGLGMAESGEADQQQRLAQFQRQGAHAAGDAGAARGMLGGAGLVLQREAAHVAAVEFDETGVNGDARDRAGAGGDGGDAALANQLVDEAGGGLFVGDVAFVAHERKPEAAQAACVFRTFKQFWHVEAPGAFMYG